MKWSEPGLVSEAEVGINGFKKDVFEGLTAPSKYLKSKYFYDEKGDKLFQRIMELPEYYLTRCELEILENYKEQIFKYVKNKQPFQLIDLGAGDAFKTKILLRYFLSEGADFTYVPVDISRNAILSLQNNLKTELADLKVNAICTDYGEALQLLDRETPKILMFLGSNIGNLSFGEAVDFFRAIGKVMTPADMLLTGFDLKKDPDVILAAYNDKQGVTREFNINLLHRINRELGANFKTGNFEHSPLYDAQSGEARSYLVSKTAQTVEIPALELSVSFKEGETIHTEISRKYSLLEIARLAENCGFNVIENLSDNACYFTDSVWRLKQNEPVLFPAPGKENQL